MTSRTRRQLGLLAVLVAVLVGVLWMRPESTAPASTGATASNETSGPVATTQREVADLRLDALKEEQQELSPAARNPFRFQARIVPRAAPVRPRPVDPAAVPAGPPPPPPIPLKFIGLLEAPSRIGRVAVLSDSRGNVFYGKEGDIIEGRYQLLRIGTDSADVAYVDGRGRQTIRLSGQ